MFVTEHKWENHSLLNTRVTKGLIDLHFTMHWQRPELYQSFLIKIICWKHQTIKLWQSFQRWLCSKLDLLNDQTLIKAYINMPYKRNRIFGVFEKIYPEKQKKKPIFVYPGLGYAHKNLNLACKIFLENFFPVQNSICGNKQKTKKFWGNFKNLCCRRQNSAIR